jgi:hypothetical protein
MDAETLSSLILRIPHREESDHGKDEDADEHSGAHFVSCGPG